MSTRRGRAAGPRPKGICPACSELRALRVGDLLGMHKRILLNSYRSYHPCPGVDHPAAIFGPPPPPRT